MKIPISLAFSDDILPKIKQLDRGEAAKICEDALRNYLNLDLNLHEIEQKLAEIRQKLTEQTAAWRGQRGGLLWAVSLADGSCLSTIDLDAPPVFDGMIAADGQLFLSLMNGEVLCYGDTSEK